MQILDKVEYDFDDVLILPKYSTLTSRKDPNLDLEREFKFYHSGQKWKGIPIISSNMNTGTFEMAKALASHKMMTALHKYYSVDQLLDFYKNNEEITDNYVFYTMGISSKDLDKFMRFIIQYKVPQLICIDVANGNMKSFIDFIREFRDDHIDSTIMAGNIVTGVVAQQLVIAGADLVKTGIGSGAQCLTRRVTGVGRPQLSAIIEVSDTVNGIGAHMVSDGGCSEIGHINKAFAGGAHFVMLGSMLAGHTETEGEIVEENGKKFIKFFGMSSNTALKQYNGGKEKYRASEGRTTLIPYRGSVHDTIDEIKGGIASCMTYINARKLKDISKCTTFTRVNNTLNRSYEKYTIGN